MTGSGRGNSKDFLLRLSKLTARHLILAVLLLGMVAIVALLLADTFRQALLTPLAYLFWMAYLLLRSVPQAVWWGLTVIFLLLLARSSLRGLRLISRKELPVKEHRPLTRSQEWMLLAALAERGGFTRWELSRQVAELALGILAHRNRMELQDAERAVAAGHFNLPASLRQALLAGVAHKKYEEYLQEAEGINASPEEFASYLEGVLEITQYPWKGDLS